MGFLDPNTDFRFILPTETDANSPISEELMSQIRENLESNMKDTKYSGLRFEVVSVDSDTQMTVTKVDPGDEGWEAGELALLITSMQTGNALGFNYNINVNTALSTGTATITYTGTTLLSDGILAGDIGLIMYSFTGVAHTHDGINSPAISADDSWHTSVDGGQWTNPSVVETFDSVTYFSGDSVGRVFCKVRMTGLSISSSNLSGMQLRMRIKAGTYEYIEATTGNYATYTIASDYLGPTMTVGTVPDGLSHLWIPMDKGLYSVDLASAGVPFDAPMFPQLDLISSASFPAFTTLNFTAEITWYSAP